MCPEQMLLSRLVDPLDSAQKFEVIPFKTSGAGNLGEGISYWSLVRAGRAALGMCVLLFFGLLAINDIED